MGSMLTLQAASALTMSSREIAELTKKEHRNVMADIRAMLMQLDMEPADFSARYLGGNNQEQPMFVLPKDLTITLVSGYNVVMRKAIIDRWMQLEAGTAAPVELSRLQILEMAMESERERVALAAQVEAAKPAVEFVGRYVESTGLMTFRQVAKLLQVKEPEFRQFLHSQKIMYPLNGEWTAHANHIEAGRFEMRAGTAQGNGHAYNTAKFTAKGVEWVAGELAKWQLKQRGEGAHV